MGDTPLRPRPSRWEQQRTGWYKDAARTDIRSGASAALYFLGAGALFAVTFGVSELGTPKGWILLTAGVAMGGLCCGVWVGYLWAGRIAGAIAALMVLLGVVSFFLTDERGPGIWLNLLFLLGLWGSAAYLLLRPSSRALFRQARTGEPAAEQAADEANR